MLKLLLHHGWHRDPLGGGRGAQSQQGLPACPSQLLPMGKSSGRTTGAKQTQHWGRRMEARGVQLKRGTGGGAAVRPRCQAEGEDREEPSACLCCLFRDPGDPVAGKGHPPQGGPYGGANHSPLAESGLAREAGQKEGILSLLPAGRAFPGSAEREVGRIAFQSTLDVRPAPAQLGQGRRQLSSLPARDRQPMPARGSRA